MADRNSMTVSRAAGKMLTGEVMESQVAALSGAAR